MKRSKNIIIRDKAPETLENSQPGPYNQDQLESLRTLLSSHGLSPNELSGLSARLVPTRPDLSNPTASPSHSHSRGLTIIVTLPHITDRTQIVTKLKRSARLSPHCESFFFDPDLTHSEAREQHTLRQERNYHNALRQAEDIATYHFGIRSGRVVKIIH